MEPESVVGTTSFNAGGRPKPWETATQDWPLVSAEEREDVFDLIAALLAVEAPLAEVLAVVTE